MEVAGRVGVGHFNDDREVLGVLWGGAVGREGRGRCVEQQCMGGCCRHALRGTRLLLSAGPHTLFWGAKEEPVSSSRMSPDCSRMSPGLERMRSPLRATATTAALNWSRKRRSRTVRPVVGGAGGRKGRAGGGLDEYRAVESEFDTVMLHTQGSRSGG